MATQRFKNWFFTYVATLRDDGSTGGVRFLKTDKPNQATFQDFAESITFKKETGDRAKITTGSMDLGTEQGLAVLATDNQAKTNATQLTDRSLVVQPSQLPTVAPSTNDFTVTTVPSDGAVTNTFSTITVTTDGTIGTRNNFLLNLPVTFTKWLLRRVLPPGGTIGQVVRKSSSTDFDYTWATLDRNNDLQSTLSIANGGTNATTANTALNNLLPTQTGNAGEVLTTDGTNSSWQSPLTNLGTVPINQGGTGQTTASTAITALLPSQTGNNGKFLETNGTSASWQAMSNSLMLLDRQVNFVTIGASVGGTAGAAYTQLGGSFSISPTSGPNRNYIVSVQMDFNTLTTQPEMYIAIFNGTSFAAAIGSGIVSNNNSFAQLHFTPPSVNGASNTVHISAYIPNVATGYNFYVGIATSGSTNMINAQTLRMIVDGTPV